MSKRIIVIEDDRDILDMMRYILGDEGYQVLSSSEAEPIETIIQQQPDLILLDEQLAETPGHEVCGHIKNHPLIRKVPVIMVSAARDLNKIANGCLADTYLAKPFDLNELIGLVKTYA